MALIVTKLSNNIIRSYNTVTRYGENIESPNWSAVLTPASLTINAFGKVVGVIYTNQALNQGNSIFSYTVPSDVPASAYAGQSGTTSGGGGGGGSSLPVSVPFSNSPPLNQIVTISSTTISAPVAFTTPAGAVAGSTSFVRVVADGVAANTPTFVGFSQLLGSSGWDNRAGIANLVQFFYDGIVYYYSITQAQGAQPIDNTAPTVVSALLNVAKDKLVITYSEPILGVITPSQYTLTGATISAAAIVGSAVELTLNPAAVGGTALTLSYTGNTIKDSANNIAATFAGASVPNAVSTGIPFTIAAGVTNTAGSYSATNPSTWDMGHSNTAVFIGDVTYKANVTRGNVMLLLDTVGDLTSYTTAEYGVYGNPNNTFSSITNGAILAASPVFQPVLPYFVRLRRTAGTLFGEASNDGVNWTIIKNFGTVAGALFCKFALNNGTITEVEVV